MPQGFIQRRTFLEFSAMSLAMSSGLASAAASGEPDRSKAANNLPQVSKPELQVPPQSCDCHVHIFEPSRFAYTPNRTYTPGTSSVADLIDFERRLGIERVVLVQPSGYGTDNSCLVDALGQLGTARARGVAVVDPQRVTAEELKKLHAAGVRAIRINLEVKGESNVERSRAVLKDGLKLVADQGWALQIYADLQVVEGLADALAASPAPVVLDHFGGLKTTDGIDHPGFATLLRLLKGGMVYAKLSAPYRATKAADFADLAPYAKALVAAAPQRLVWASDWPHTGSASRRGGDLSQVEPFRPIDDGRVLDLLASWAPDPAVRRQILVDNAARLYRF